MIPASDQGPGPDSSHLPAVVPTLHAGVPATPSALPALAANPDPIALLRALRRRWPLAVGSGLLCAAVVAVAVYLAVPPAKYTARAMLHVNSVQPRILLQVGEAGVDYGAYQRTQLAMLKSRLVLNAALEQPGISRLPVFRKIADPTEWLEKELQVDFAQGSEVLRIIMSGSNPTEPMMLVNAVMQAYLDEVVHVEARKRRERYDLLKETWTRYQENMREKRKELKRLTELAGSDDKRTLASLQQYELNRLERSEDELARIQIELRNLRVELEVLQKEDALNASTISRGMIEAEINEDPSIATLAGRVVQAQRALGEVSRLARLDSDPAVQRHRQDYNAARAALAEQRQKLYPIVARQLQEQSRSDLGSRSVLLQERIKILSKIEAALADDVKRLSERNHSITQNSVDLFSIQEEIAAADDVAKKVGNEIEALNLELQAPPRIRPLEEAELPRTKDESRKFRMAGMAGGGVFAFVLVGISFWEFWARRIDSANEVVQGLGIRLVGTLPALPQRSRLLISRDAASLRWQGLLVESVDAARTALLHASRTESIRAVMIASALSGEGKTSLASHLATSLARAGRRTLLIDGDLRRPSVHELFDLPAVPGLSELLRDEIEIDDAIRPTPAGGLWLLPAGSRDSEAIQALAYRDLRAMLERLKERFDFIVIDSSPILPVADALLIGQHVDAVLFSIMRDVSRLPKVHAACERIAALDIRLLGAIVSGEQTEHYGSVYQYVGRSLN